MAPRRTYEMANTALRGKLAEVLRAKRADGHTFDQIAHDLTTLGIPTSRETVRRWCQTLDIPVEAKAS